MTMWILEPQPLLVGKGKHVKVLKVSVSVHLKLFKGKLRKCSWGFNPRTHTPT